MPPRSRKFDGCWTCRHRKIKCDGARPVCARCQKAKVECKGYDIVLAWADFFSVDKSGSMVTVPMTREPSHTDRDGGLLRRNVEFVKFPRRMTYTTYDSLNAAVELFDCEELDRKGHLVGPFSVYAPGAAARPQSRPSPQEARPLPQEARPVPQETRPLPQEMRPLPQNMGPLPQVMRRPTLLQSAPSTDTRGASLEGLAPSESLYGSQVTATVINGEVMDRDASIFSKTDNSYVHFELLDYAKLTILAIKGPRYKFNEQGMFHILYPTFFPNVESDDWRPNTEILLTLFRIAPNGDVSLSALLGPTMGFLSAPLISFVRVAHVNNSWDVLVVPFLKQLIFELVCEDLPKYKSWRPHLISRNMPQVLRSLLIRNIRLAVLCMTLAITCFQKAARQPRVKNPVNSFYVSEDMAKAIELRKIGINILNFHLDEYDDNSEHEADGYDTHLLLAMILQIELDNAFGVYENYELVYAIGDFLLKKVHMGSMTPLDHYLRKLFRVLNIFYQSTQAINFFNYSISEKDQKFKYLDLNANYDLSKQPVSDKELSDEGSDSDSDEEITVAPMTQQNGSPISIAVHFSKNAEPARKKRHISSEGSNPKTPTLDSSSFYVSCGLPKSLLMLFDDVVQLTNHKNVFKTKGLTPRNFPRICAETEDRVLSWNVENHWKLYANQYDPIANVATKVFISDFHEGLYYNVTCFRNALIVYFKRLIPGAPLESYQQYISASMDALQKLIDLNAKNEPKDIFYPSFWALLVCGCDIDLASSSGLKEKCMGLWKADCFQKYNYWRSKQILFEVWNRREDGENIGFMDMVREWDVVLSLG